MRGLNLKSPSSSNTTSVKPAWRLFLLIVAIFLISKFVHAQSAPEKDLRAAVVFGILKLVDFNDQAVVLTKGVENSSVKATPGNKISSVNNATTAKKLCVIGSPIAKAGIDKVINKSLVKNLSFDVSYHQTLSNTSDCNVMLVSKDVNLRGHYKSRTVDTFIICDDCAKYDGISAVSIRRVRSRVGFYVNMGVVNKLGISLSSNVLELAAGIKESSRAK